MCIKLLFPPGGGGYNSFCASLRDRTQKRRSRKRPCADDCDYANDIDVLTLFEFIPKLRRDAEARERREEGNPLPFSLFRLSVTKNRKRDGRKATMRCTHGGKSIRRPPSSTTSGRPSNIIIMSILAGSM